MLLRSFQDRFTGGHHPQINHFISVATQNDADNVLADVVHSPFTVASTMQGWREGVCEFCFASSMLDWQIIFFTFGIECGSMLRSVKFPRPSRKSVAMGSPPNSPQIETFFPASLAASKTDFNVFNTAG